MTATSVFKQSMKSLLDSGEYSDLKITCNGEEWKVHKSLVCTQSNFFKAAIRFGGKETNDNVIDLPDDDPVAIGCMIRFMYEMDYQLPSEFTDNVLWMRVDWKDWKCDPDGKPNSLPVSSRREADRLCWEISGSWVHLGNLPKRCVARFTEGRNNSERAFGFLYHASLAEGEAATNPTLPINHRDAFINAQVYSVADKYNIPELKSLAAAKFKQSLEEMFSGSDFFEAVSAAFTTTPDTDDTLRTIVAEHIYKEKEIYGMYEELEAHMQTVPGLAYHVLKYEWSMQHSFKNRAPMPSRSSRARSQARSQRRYQRRSRWDLRA